MKANGELARLFRRQLDEVSAAIAGVVRQQLAHVRATAGVDEAFAAPEPLPETPKELVAGAPEQKVDLTPAAAHAKLIGNTATQGTRPWRTGRLARKPAWVSKDRMSGGHSQPCERPDRVSGG